MDEGARRVLLVALRSWASTFRLCVIVIVVVAATTVAFPGWPVLHLVPRLFMT